MAKATSNAKKPLSRYRMMFRFWMDGNKNDELAIADYLEEMKHRRSLTATIRDAVRLIQDLRQQRLDVLFQLFPWINAWLEERAEAIAAAKSRTSGGDNSGGNIIDLQAQINRLENLLLQQVSGGAGMLMMAKEPQLKALPVPRILPDEPTISIRAASSGNVTTNFMKSLGALGVALKPAPSDSGIRKMAVQPLAAPNFDDLDEAKPLA